MGRCTAVDILMLEGNVPAHCGPEAMLRPDQRLPLLEEVWEVLTDAEREAIANRLDEKQHGVRGAQRRAIDGISLREHCVRWLRRMHVTAALSDADLKIKAAEFERNIGADAERMLRDAEQPGAIDGYPHTAQRATSTKN